MGKTLQIRVDSNLSKQAEEIFSLLGIDTSTAVRIFLSKVVATRSIPFDLKLKVTENGFTEEFEEKVLKAEKTDPMYGPFSSVEEFFNDLEK